MTSSIIKTWPAFMTRAHTLEVFSHEFARFYFTLGLGQPQRAIDKLYFTHHGEIIGWFVIEQLKQNDGTLPKLRSLSGEESPWQIKPDRWVAICRPPFNRLHGRRVFHGAFRGWHYFDLDTYAATSASRVNLED